MLVKGATGNKPLTHPMLTCCQWKSWEQIPVKFESKYNNFHIQLFSSIFHSRKLIWKCCLQNDGHLVHALIFSPLWPSGTIWWQRIESTLVQVMAWCLMAPSHYLNQCWLLIHEVQRHSPESNFTMRTQVTSLYLSLKITLLKCLPYLPVINGLNATERALTEFHIWMLYQS